MQEGQSLLREHSGSSAAGGGAQGVAMGTPAAPAAGNTPTAAQLSEALAEQRRLIRPIVLEFGTSSLPALPCAAQRRGASLHAPAVPGRQSRGSGPGSQGVGRRGKAPPTAPASAASSRGQPQPGPGVAGPRESRPGRAGPGAAACPAAVLTAARSRTCFHGHPEGLGGKARVRPGPRPLPGTGESLTDALGVALE